MKTFRSKNRNQPSTQWNSFGKYKSCLILSWIFFCSQFLSIEKIIDWAGSAGRLIADGDSWREILHSEMRFTLCDFTFLFKLSTWTSFHDHRHSRGFYALCWLVLLYWVDVDCRRRKSSKQNRQQSHAHHPLTLSSWSVVLWRIISLVASRVKQHEFFVFKLPLRKKNMWLWRNENTTRLCMWKPW